MMGTRWIELGSGVALVKLLERCLRSFQSCRSLQSARLLGLFILMKQTAISGANAKKPREVKYLLVGLYC